MADVIDWRGFQVYRDSRYESLVEKLCATKGSGDFLFSTVKELMVFAALVGYQHGTYKPLKNKLNCIQISLGTYANTKHDAYIYLLALTKLPSVDILKDDQLRDAIGIFEGYCNAGLEYIDSWILSKMGESKVENILYLKTLEFLSEKY